MPALTVCHLDLLVVDPRSRREVRDVVDAEAMRQYPEVVPHSEGAVESEELGEAPDFPLLRVLPTRVRRLHRIVGQVDDGKRVILEDPAQVHLMVGRSPISRRPASPGRQRTPGSAVPSRRRATSSSASLLNASITPLAKFPLSRSLRPGCNSRAPALRVQACPRIAVSIRAGLAPQSPTPKRRRSDEHRA